MTHPDPKKSIRHRPWVRYECEFAVNTLTIHGPRRALSRGEYRRGDLATALRETIGDRQTGAVWGYSVSWVIALVRRRVYTAKTADGLRGSNRSNGRRQKIASHIGDRNTRNHAVSPAIRTAAGNAARARKT